LKTFIRIVLSAIAVSAVVFVAGCSKDDLTFVKKGHTSFNKSVAIGEALDSYRYFGKKEWLTEKTPQGARLVIFKADMNPQFIKELNEACGTQTDQGKRIESQKWSIQFTINKADAIYVSATETLTISADKTRKSGPLSEALLKKVYENKLAAVCM